MGALPVLLLTTIVCHATAAETPRAGKPQDPACSARAAVADGAAGGSRFDPAQSAGLFVGIRNFRSGIVDVRYTVDDAVDLAYMLTLDTPAPLLYPQNVDLALSGEPQKAESRERLRILLKAGAKVYPAEQTEILERLEKQANKAEKDGIVVVSVATTASGPVLCVSPRSRYSTTPTPCSRPATPRDGCVLESAPLAHPHRRMQKASRARHPTRPGSETGHDSTAVRGAFSRAWTGSALCGSGRSVRL